MGKHTMGLVGLWDCVTFNEVARIRFKDKDGIQILKDYMASGSFARGKEEKAASASMVFVGNINQSVDVLLKTSSLFDPFPPEMGTDTAFLDRLHCCWEIPKLRPECFTDDYGFITDYLAEFLRELRKEQYGDALDRYFRFGKILKPPYCRIIHPKRVNIRKKTAKFRLYFKPFRHNRHPFLVERNNNLGFSNTL